MRAITDSKAREPWRWPAVVTREIGLQQLSAADSYTSTPRSHDVDNPFGTHSLSQSFSALAGAPRVWVWLGALLTWWILALSSSGTTIALRPVPLPAET
jgi:hypothetical protein